MANLILHIGSEKTGTTSIQHFLMANSDKLFAKEYFIPQFLDPWGQGNHWLLAFMCYPPGFTDELVTSAILDKLLSPAEVRRDTDAMLKSYISKHGNKTWVISTEHLHSRLCSIEDLYRLRSTLNDLFDSVKIIIYIRHPLQSAISLWSTGVYYGQTDRVLPSPEALAPILNYHLVLSRWISVFGRSSINVRIYDRSKLVNGDVIDDFCSFISLDNIDSLAKPEQMNTSMSHRAISILSRLNARLPEQGSGGTNLERDRLAGLVKQYFSSYPKYLATRKDLGVFDAYYRESIEWLRETFFPCNDVLWPVVQPCAEENEPPLTEDDLIWIELVAELAYTKPECTL